MYAGRIVEELRRRRARPRAAPLHARPARLPALARRTRKRPAAGAWCATPAWADSHDRASRICACASARIEAVKGVSFAVPTGGSFGIVGESGSGKSTVLRALSGLNPDWTGRMALDGTDLTPRRAERLLPPRADGVPGPLRLAASAPDRRPRALRAAHRARHPRHRRAHRRARWPKWRCRPRCASATRTSSPAASASASPSPAR